ncbi:MAG: putative HMP/thiamine import ATP-binding protein YkoD [Firmicutes bacterium ADurb.Bin373]|nr:MAG: putative HMP/thiamine import ATP-binding protein YkoD [Firmicutes bacterium ADurb.Bin373]
MTEIDLPVVCVGGVTFKYEGSREPAISDINLRVDKGEFISITGGSGCGKSTLALCLAGFIPHHVGGEMSGSVIVNGMDSRQCPPQKLAGAIGLVQQDPEAQLCTLKVVDEVAFGPENLCLSREEIKDRVEWALGAVGSLHLRDREVYSLSGGEKQRVAIASVLTMKPALIILDEPTANLDPCGTTEVLQVIKKMEADTAVIIIEHRLRQLIPISNRLLVMDKGRIICDGEPGHVYKNYCSRQKYYFDFGYNTGEEESSNQSTTKERHSQANPVLSVRELTVSCGGKRILEDINFDIHPGQITAVMGCNGSGKTTLLLSLLGINKLERGRIVYRSRDITAEKVSRRARHMGMVFQNPNHQIFENTVYREAALPSIMLFGGESAINAGINSLLLEFDLLQYKEGLPFSLSLGEKKRLTLVSVLGYNPEMLLLDEPLIGQDYRRADIFWQAVLKHRSAGGMAVIVCHEPDFVRDFCNRILFLENGKLLLDSTAEEGFKLLEELGFKDYLPGSNVIGDLCYGQGS